MARTVDYCRTPVSRWTCLRHDRVVALIAAQVFGAPWCVVDGEPFRGQDRLDFIGSKLAQ